jgi:uncharacterized protein YdbL (DUF1318 family)
MEGLVSELQRDALDNNVTAGNLLKKALVISRKLKIDSYREWINNELNGYSDISLIPEYRTVHGQVEAFNPYNGWIPFFFEDEESANIFKIRKVHDPIENLDELSKYKDGCLQMTFPAEMEKYLISQQTYPMKVRFSVAPNVLMCIVSTVRNKILNWSLELEEQGITGEGMSFSQEEKELATHMTTNINIGGNFQGNLGDIKNSTVNQNLTMDIKKNNFESLSNYLKSNGISNDDIANLKQCIEEDPKPVSTEHFGSKVGRWIGEMVGKSASGIWNIGIDTAGALLTKAISFYYGIPS